MIPRILVPKNARMAEPSPDAPPRRLRSDLDSRTLVPSDLPHIELDGHSSIPSYFQLDVLPSSVVVPRDMPRTPLDATSKTPDYVPLSILDSRVAVPKDAHLAELQPHSAVAIQDLPDVIDPDVLTTGEVILMAKPVEERKSAWNTAARIASIAFHFLVILLIFVGPPRSQPKQNEIAQQNVTDLYLPPDVNNVPREREVPRPKSPVMRIDPRLLQKLAPPREFQPPPGPAPQQQITRDTPKPSASSALTAPIAPPRPQQQAQVDSPIQPPPPQENNPNSLVLPHFSPGRALQESLHEALKQGGSASAQFGGPSGYPGGGGMPGGGGGGGNGYLGGAVQMLTPTEGVDFSNYLARVLASVKRNWYAVMPESARLGDRGRVILQFRIMQNGVVPDAEPVMVGSSGKEPLDRAAMSSIRASTPFEPLPSAFSGPFIELRFIFLYNLPLNSGQ
jgi:TonB family protein